MSLFRFRLMITHKIAAIGAMGVAGVLTIGGIYLVGAHQQSGFRAAADREKVLATRTGAVYLEMLESRRSEKDFFLRHDMKYPARVAQLGKAIDAELTSLAETSAGAGLADRFTAVRDGFGKYLKHFMAAVDAKQRLGLNETSGLEGALRTSVHAIETKLKAFDEPRLAVIMLMMRRHEKDFMLRGRVSYGGDMKKRGVEFVAGLAASAMPEAEKADLRQKLANYHRDFFAWMDVAVELAGEQKHTSSAYAAIEPLIDGLKKDFDERYASAGAADDLSRTETARQMQIAIGLVALSVLALALWIGRLVSRPITAIAGTMEQLARGNMEVDVEAVRRADEIGRMGKAVLVFKEAAIERVRLEKLSAEQRQQAEDARAQHAAAQVKAAEERMKAADAQLKATEEQAQAVEALAGGLARLSQGDLTARLDRGLADAYRKIRDDFNAAMTHLQDTVGAIATATREVSSAAAESAGHTANLSQRTEEQAASLEQTSASMEQIASIVSKNAEHARQASDLAASTRGVADRGGKVVADAVEAMSLIEQSSHKIADIIGVIDEIARQTNLLALNAAVEAARAGEAGRGFAVVASEVRSLAQRSAQAAKDIKDLIVSSSGQVKNGVDLVGRTGEALHEIVRSIHGVAELVSGIATASAEQAGGIEQVNKALAQMDEITQQNSALVEENAATAKTLERQSVAMTERVAFFRVGAPSPAAADRPANGMPRALTAVKRERSAS